MQLNAYIVSALDPIHLVNRRDWNHDHVAVIEGFRELLHWTNYHFPFLLRSNFRIIQRIYCIDVSSLSYVYFMFVVARLCVCMTLICFIVLQINFVAFKQRRTEFYVWCDYIKREYLYAKYRRVKHTHVKYVTQNTFATPCDKQFYGVCNNDLQVLIGSMYNGCNYLSILGL